MQCNVDCGLLKASRSSHTYYTPPLLPPTQDVVHRRSRLKFLSSSLFDPLNAAVVVVVAEAAALKRNFLLQYSFSFLPSLQVLLKMGRFYQVTAMLDIKVAYIGRWSYCTQTLHVSHLKKNIFHLNLMSCRRYEW